MKPFAIISSEILTSSIWLEPDDFRVVWFTLILMADTEGVVRALDPGISQMARVPLERTAAALVRFQEADPLSRNPDHDGRRIERISGGYRILNMESQIAAASMRKEANRARVARWRERRRGVTPVTPCNALQGVTVMQEKREKGIGNREVRQRIPAAAPQEKQQRPAKPPQATPSWSKDACDDWIGRFGGTAPGGMIGKALKPLVERHGWPMVREAWRSYLAQVEAEYASPSRFASTFGRWSGGMEEAGTVHAHNRAVARALVGGGR